MEIGDKVITRKDIEYASGKGYENGLGKLDLYLPAKAKNFPALIFIHGGGLQAGDKSKLDQVGRRFALLGIAVVAPNYRLSRSRQGEGLYCRRIRRWASRHAPDPR